MLYIHNHYQLANKLIHNIQSILMNWLKNQLTAYNNTQPQCRVSTPEKHIQSKKNKNQLNDVFSQSSSSNESREIIDYQHEIKQTFKSTSKYADDFDYPPIPQAQNSIRPQDIIEMEEEKPNQMEYVDEYYEEPSYHEADIVEEPKVVEKKPELILQNMKEKKEIKFQPQQAFSVQQMAVIEQQQNEVSALIKLQSLFSQQNTDKPTQIIQKQVIQKKEQSKDYGNNKDSEIKHKEPIPKSQNKYKLLFEGESPKPEKKIKLNDQLNQIENTLPVQQINQNNNSTTCQIENKQYIEVNQDSEFPVVSKTKPEFYNPKKNFIFQRIQTIAKSKHQTQNFDFFKIIDEDDKKVNKVINIQQTNPKLQKPVQPSKPIDNSSESDNNNSMPQEQFNGENLQEVLLSNIHKKFKKKKINQNIEQNGEIRKKFSYSNLIFKGRNQQEAKEKNIKIQKLPFKAHVGSISGKRIKGYMIQYNCKWRNTEEQGRKWLQSTSTKYYNPNLLYTFEIRRFQSQFNQIIRTQITKSVSITQDSINLPMSMQSEEQQKPLKMKNEKSEQKKQVIEIPESENRATRRKIQKHYYESDSEQKQKVQTKKPRKPQLKAEGEGLHLQELQEDNIFLNADIELEKAKFLFENALTQIQTDQNGNDNKQVVGIKRNVKRQSRMKQSQQ